MCERKKSERDENSVDVAAWSCCMWLTYQLVINGHLHSSSGKTQSAY